MWLNTRENALSMTKTSKKGIILSNSIVSNNNAWWWTYGWWGYFYFLSSFLVILDFFVTFMLYFFYHRYIHVHIYGLRFWLFHEQSLPHSLRHKHYREYDQSRASSRAMKSIQSREIVEGSRKLSNSSLESRSLHEHHGMYRFMHIYLNILINW